MFIFISLIFLNKVSYIDHNFLITLITLYFSLFLQNIFAFLKQSFQQNLILKKSFLRQPIILSIIMHHFQHILFHLVQIIIVFSQNLLFYHSQVQLAFQLYYEAQGCYLSISLFYFFVQKLFFYVFTGFFTQEDIQHTFGQTFPVDLITAAFETT